MSDFLIRTATASDVPAIVSLIRELADYEKLQAVLALDEASVIRDFLGTACHTNLAVVDGAAAGIVLPTCNDWVVFINSNNCV